MAISRADFDITWSHKKSLFLIAQGHLVRRISLVFLASFILGKFMIAGHDFVGVGVNKIVAI